MPCGNGSERRVPEKIEGESCLAAQKKPTTSRKTSGKSTGKKSGGQKRTSGGSRSKSSSSRTKRKSSGIVITRRMAGLILCVPTLLLLLAMAGLSGLLLDPLWKFATGLIGWGIYPFAILLGLDAILLMSNIQPYRLRVLCVTVIPFLWSAIVQCVRIGDNLPLSFSSIGILWQTGIQTRSAGVIAGLLAMIAGAAVSQTGAKIILSFFLIVCVFAALQQTPWGLIRQLIELIQEEDDVEYLEEDDMTVTPGRRRKKKAPPVQEPPVTQKTGELSLENASLWDIHKAKKKQKRAAKAMEKAQRAKAEAEEAERLLGAAPSASKEPEEFPSDEKKRENSRRAIERQQRLSEVMPQGTPKPRPESKFPDIDRLMDWGKAPREDAAPESRTEPITRAEPAPEDDPAIEAELKREQKASKAALAAAKKQVEAEIAGAMENHDVPPYLPPSLDLLNRAKRTVRDSQAELESRAAQLLDTLDSFGIEAHLIDKPIVGPTITRFELQMERGIKISRITSLNNDIGLALGSQNLRIVMVPEKNAIGIEVANHHPTMVTIRDVLSSPEFTQSRAELPVALGKDITGKPQVIDLAKMPHLMIAGTTGSGKSVCINSILISLLYQFSSEDLRLIMIDPKIVELSNYNGIPQLLIPVVTDPKKASGALNWAVTEMDRRYALFASEGVRKMEDYNQLMRQREAEEARQAAEAEADLPPFDVDEPAPDAPKEKKPTKVLPKIVIIIDELADLMMVSAKEVEGSICRLAQKARAAGMYLVVATQRPSADVITGLMKSNIPSRIAFAVASGVESRIIMDTTGAEKLLGGGDMLYHPLGASKPKRIQGAFISTEEIERVIAHVKTTGAVEYSEEAQTHIEQAGGDGSAGYDAAEDEDPLLQDAVSIVVSSGQASTSMLQRRLKLGYARAARVMDQMEERGIIGPSEGSKPRRVLITKDEWMEIQLRRDI